MLNFLKKPLGYTLIVIAHCMLANQVSNQFFPTPHQIITQFTWPLGVWTIAAIYAFLMTLLLYRLLIKQEPFSKDFKKSASKWYAIIAISQTLVYFFASKILYVLNPEIAAKLLSENTVKLLEQSSLMVIFIALGVLIAMLFPLIYWMNYFYLWLTDKIVNFFLKHKNA